MAAISGKDGKVASDAVDLAEITAWSFNPTSNNPSWASSGTSGYKKRVAGVKDGTGSFDFKLDAASEMYDTIVEGSEVTLTLYLNATLNFSVPAIIDGVTYDVNIDDGETVSGTASFSTNGAWTNP